ncbi:MAG: hypothetical protein R2912_04410 [Eubacteriales bacterium]
MSQFTEIELREAARAIASTRMKTEKAILKLKDGSAQQRNTARGIAAYSLALQLIARELGDPYEPTAHDKESLDQAIEVCASMTTRVSRPAEVCRRHAAAYARCAPDQGV